MGHLPSLMTIIIIIISVQVITVCMYYYILYCGLEIHGEVWFSPPIKWLKETTTTFKGGFHLFSHQSQRGSNTSCSFLWTMYVFMQSHVKK
jgi:hypothetical protein